MWRLAHFMSQSQVATGGTAIFDTFRNFGWLSQVLQKVYTNNKLCLYFPSVCNSSSIYH